MKQYCCFDKKSLTYILEHLALQKPFRSCGYYVSKGNLCLRLSVVCSGTQATYHPAIAFHRNTSTLLVTAVTACVTGVSAATAAVHACHWCRVRLQWRQLWVSERGVTQPVTTKHKTTCILVCFAIQIIFPGSSLGLAQAASQELWDLFCYCN